MPRHRTLNLKKFVESIPEHLLAEYFREFAGGGLPTPQGYDYESINEFLDGLPDEDLASTIREDFTRIHDVCEKTMNYLVRALRRYNIETTGEEATHALAMDIFLHHKQAFEYAYDYYCLFNSSGKMSQHIITADHFDITDEKLEKFTEKVREFYFSLAKGRECIVKHYDEKDQAVIVIMHGSYKRSQMVWESDEPKTRFFRRVTEDVLQYNKTTSILTIKAPYKRDKDNYILAFAETIVQDESQAEREDRDETYSLDPLQKGTFSFAGNNIIRSVTLLEIRLVIRGVTSSDLIIKSSDVLTTLRDDIRDVNLNSGDLVHAKFRFRLEVDGRLKNVTFEITPPNVTDLTKKKYGEIIGAYLKEQGVKLV